MLVEHSGMYTWVEGWRLSERAAQVSSLSVLGKLAWVALEEASLHQLGYFLPKQLAHKHPKECYLPRIGS